MWYCARCKDPYDDDIRDSACVTIEKTDFCYSHATLTSLLDYAEWRDMPTGDPTADRELGLNGSHAKAPATPKDD